MNKIKNIYVFGGGTVNYIVFNKNVPAKLIINFIDQNFDLSKKTGGYNLS